MVKPKYKVVYGYSADQEIPIEEKDLEKAIYAHMTKSRARLNGIPSFTQFSLSSWGVVT